MENAVPSAIALSASKMLLDQIECFGISHGIVEIARIRTVVKILVFEIAFEPQLIKKVGNFLQPDSTNELAPSSVDDGRYNLLTLRHSQVPSPFSLSPGPNRFQSNNE